MLNQAAIMGRLTRDPELRHTTTNTPVATITLAVDRDYRDRDTGEKGVDFINVVAWRNTAEFAGKYLKKGRLVAVTGRIQVREYTDKDGNKRKVVEVVADSLYPADSKPQTYDEPESQINDDEDLPF